MSVIVKWAVIAGFLAMMVAKIHVLGIFWAGVLTLGQMVLSGVLDEYSSYREMKKLPYTIERDAQNRVVWIMKDQEKVTT